jgi:hypothetical protein
MKTLYLFILFICMGIVPIQAQSSTDKFAKELCTCLKKMKPETISTASAVKKELLLCYSLSIMAHEKQLKKDKVIDFETSTDEETATFMTDVFKRCPEANEAAHGRIEFLENEEAAKSFQGRIVYVQDIELSGAFKKMGITKEEMLEELKKDGEWPDTLYTFYRLGNYASIGNNKKQTQRIYDSDVNTIYSFSVGGSGICSVQEAVDLDLSGAPDKPTITELDSTATILGLPCKIIRMKWKLSQFDYYYNSTQAKVDPLLFAKHSSEGLAEFVRMTNCLPLQIVKSTMGMVMIQTAIDIKQGQVDTDMFGIPELIEDESLNAIKLPGITMMRIKE